MHCPSCDKQSALKPTKLNENLSARECIDCRGVLINLLAYRVWRDRWAMATEGPKHDITEVKDSSHALLCPNCVRVMLKFRIGTETPNTIDVCTHCDIAWLDEGEWELLGALTLQSKLTKIFGEPWQRQLRQAQIEEAETKRNEELVGKDTMVKLNELISWIEEHPQKDDVLRILRGKLG